MALVKRGLSAWRRMLRARIVRPGGQPRPVLPGQQGFTLVELLVAITLMAIGMFAVIGMQIFSMRSNTIAHRLTVATSLAQQVFEDIMLWDPATAKGQCFVTPGTYAYYADPANPAQPTVTVQGAGTFTPTYTTVVGPASGVPSGVVKVVVTVAGAGRTVTITGFKRNV